MKTVEEDRWVTDEISLAAYVALVLGMDPKFEWDGDSCSFSFPKTAELMTKVVQFVGGDAVVEPREYHMKASSIRKAMFSARRGQ